MIKKNICILIIALAAIEILRTTEMYALLKINSVQKNSDPVAKADSILTSNENKIDIIDTTGKIGINKEEKISETNTTWGRFLDSYINETKEYYNPRQDISKKHKVRVVKTEYLNGYETKAGFYNYALITQVFDEKTGELLNSIGEYKNLR